MGGVWGGGSERVVLEDRDELLLPTEGLAKEKSLESYRLLGGAEGFFATSAADRCG